MTSYKGRKKPTTGRDGTPIAGKRSGTTIIPTSGRTMHGSSGLTGRVLDPNARTNGMLPGQTVSVGSINMPTQPSVDRIVTNPENVWWPQAEGANTLPLIWQLLNNSNQGGSLSQGYADILAQLQKMMADSHNPVNPDLVMQIFSNLLSYQTTQDQRQYDYMMLNEGRLYNTPTNELARFMGAGISRDAVLQMLSGGAGASGGAGSDAAQMMGMTGSAGSAASYGSSNQQGQINTILNGINTFAGLVNMGFGVAQSYQQYQYLKNQNVLSQGQAAAYNATGDLYGLMNSLGAKESDYKSLKSAAAFVDNAAKTGNVEAAQFIASGKMAALRRNPNLVSRNLSQLYRSENDADLFLSEARRASAEALVSEKTVAKLGVDIRKAEADIVQIQNNSEFIKQQTETSSKMAEVYVQQAEYLKKQGKVAEAEVLLKQAQKLKTDAETTGLNLTNEQADAWMHTEYAGQTGLEWLTTKTLNELSRDARVAEKTSSPAFVDATFFSMYNSAQKIRFVSALDVLASQTGLEFAEKYPELYHQWTVLQQCGAYDFLDAISKGNYTYDASTGVTMFGVDFGFKTTQTSNTTSDYLEDISW